MSRCVVLDSEAMSALASATPKRRQRDVRALHDRSDRDGELLAAWLGLALIDAGAVLRAFQLRHVARGAVRADGAIGPALRFQMRAGCILVVINLVGQVDHGRVPCL